MIGSLQHRHSLLALQHPGEQVRRKRPEHREIEHPDLQVPGFPQVVTNRFGVADYRALSHEHVLSILQPVPGDACVLSPGERGEFGHGLVGQRCDVVKEERPLRCHTLAVRVLILYHSDHRRIVDVEHLGYAASLLAKHPALGGCRRIDDVRRVAEIFLHAFPLREQSRLDHVCRQKAILSHDSRVQRQLGRSVCNKRQVAGFLNVLREKLEEPRVVNGVIVIMPRVNVQRMLGHRPGADVEHVGQPLSHGRIERLMHVGDALTAREIRGSQTGHAHTRRDSGGGVFAFGLEEDEFAAVDVALAHRHRLGPTLPHVRGRSDRICSCRLGRVGFSLNRRSGTVCSRQNPRILRRSRIAFILFHFSSLLTNSSVSANCCPSSQTMAPVGHLPTASGLARTFFS